MRIKDPSSYFIRQVWTAGMCQHAWLFDMDPTIPTQVFMLAQQALRHRAVSTTFISPFTTCSFPVFGLVWLTNLLSSRKPELHYTAQALNSWQSCLSLLALGLQTWATTIGLLFPLQPWNKCKIVMANLKHMTCVLYFHSSALLLFNRTWKQVCVAFLSGLVITCSLYFLQKCRALCFRQRK